MRFASGVWQDMESRANVLDAVCAHVAAHPDDGSTYGLGLSTTETNVLAAITGGLGWPRDLAPVAGPISPVDEIEPDVVALLVGGARPGMEGSHLMARLVARRALVPGHLYLAMGLSERADLSAFLRHWFPGVCGRNDGTMRWKRFLYRELCAAEGAILCKSPVCADCVDRAECFV